MKYIALTIVIIAAVIAIVFGSFYIVGWIYSCIFNKELPRYEYITIGGLAFFGSIIGAYFIYIVWCLSWILEKIIKV